MLLPPPSIVVGPSLGLGPGLGIVQRPSSIVWIGCYKEAVRTCVLARRWRDLWKHATGLRIIRATGSDPASARELRKFVYHLLLLRESLPLHTFKLKLRGFDEEDVAYLNLWIRHAVRCKVQVLQLDVLMEDHPADPFLQLDNLPLISSHLTRLQLYGLNFSDNFLNFSGCPALKDLEITNCDFLDVKKLLSLSLKHLTIRACFNSQQFGPHISTPGLVSLHLDDPTNDRAPVLESMPELVVAYVNVFPYLDKCDCDCFVDYCRHVMGTSILDSDSNNEHDAAAKGYDSMLLGGLSEAKDLTLLAPNPKMARLEMVPYVCEVEDFGPEHKVEMQGSRNPTEITPGISECLKIVSVKCEVVDERVLSVMKFLSRHNIRFSFKD
ncbi:hypothetical protein EJB05_28182, partial [Eragrostis curvula]